MLKKRVLAIVLVFTVSGFMLCQGSAYSYVKTNNNENEENIVSHEINTVVSGAAINTYSSEAMMKFKQKKVESNSIKENYIVVTKDDIGKKKIETNYDIAEISELSGYARDEDIVTLCISGDTATRLQKSEDIEYIEKDTTVFACTNRKEKVKQIRKIRKVIEKKHKKDEKAWNQQMIKTVTMIQGDWSQERTTEAKVYCYTKTALIRNEFNYDFGWKLYVPKALYSTYIEFLRKDIQMNCLVVCKL